MKQPEKLKELMAKWPDRLTDSWPEEEEKTESPQFCDYMKGEKRQLTMAHN